MLPNMFRIWWSYRRHERFSPGPAWRQTKRWKFCCGGHSACQLIWEGLHTRQGISLIDGSLRIEAFCRSPRLNTNRDEETQKIGKNMVRGSHEGVETLEGIRPLTGKLRLLGVPRCRRALRAMGQSPPSFAISADA